MISNNPSFLITALQFRDNTDWNRVILLLSSSLLLSPLLWMIFVYTALTCPTWTIGRWLSFRHFPVSAQRVATAFYSSLRKTHVEAHLTVEPRSRCCASTSPSEMCRWANPEKNSQSAMVLQSRCTHAHWSTADIELKYKISLTEH